MMLGRFEIAVLVLHSTFMFVKILLTAKFAPNAARANDYPPKIALFQTIHAFLLTLPFLWIIGLFNFTTIIISLPLFVRVLGIILLVLNICFMIWQMNSLSVNISANHDGRFLVKSGPYRLVRHPLYLIFNLLMVSFFFTTTNIIFLGAFFVSIIASKIRADYEESILLQEYGSEYSYYQEETSQLFIIF